VAVAVAGVDPVRGTGAVIGAADRVQSTRLVEERVETISNKLI
jgi:hypothetical protein